MAHVNSACDFMKHNTHPKARSLHQWFLNLVNDRSLPWSDKDKRIEALRREHVNRIKGSLSRLHRNSFKALDVGCSPYRIPPPRNVNEGMQRLAISASAGSPPLSPQSRAQQQPVASTSVPHEHTEQKQAVTAVVSSHESSEQKRAVTAVIPSSQQATAVVTPASSHDHADQQHQTVASTQQSRPAVQQNLANLLPSVGPHDPFGVDWDAATQHLAAPAVSSSAAIAVSSQQPSSHGNSAAASSASSTTSAAAASGVVSDEEISEGST